MLETKTAAYIVAGFALVISLLAFWVIRKK
jgi:LPXTG-motif cell wall-anchored protein